jgi:large subunit ribosomal protein L11
MDSVVKISKMKLDVSYARDLKSTAKEIIGSCLSLGIKVEDKIANDVYADITAGKYDSLFE